jgi:threonine dehydrogenase-like Zn-dependent dehydrogenase
VLVPAENLIKLSHDADLLEACLVEPVAFARHCTGGLDGCTVAVIGQGTIGLSCSMLLHYMKNRVISLDIEDSQLVLSKKLGSDWVINSKREDPTVRVREIAGTEGIDWVIDTVFNEWSIKFSLDILNKGGTMITVGVPRGELHVDALRLLCREVSIKTRFLYTREDFAWAADIVMSRKVDFSPLISKVFELKDIEQAFAYKAGVPCQKVVMHNDLKFIPKE